MRFSKYLSTGILIAYALPAFCQTLVSSTLLLIHSNSPIAFDKVDSKVIRNAVDQLIKLTDGHVKIIISGLKPGAGPGTTLSAYDELSYDLNDLGMKLGLIAQTFLSDSVRNAANDGLQALSDYQTTLLLNEALYKALKK